VSSADAVRLSRELARKEGVFTGTSGGATLAGALQVCESASDGSTVLCMLPDTGERYLSTPLFDGVTAEMSAEEIEISNSTPSTRWQDAPPVAPEAATAVEGCAEIEELVRSLLADREYPVVLIAFEWCEFSWSVRKLFARCKVPFRSVDIDSAELQKDGRGAKIRAAISARTRSPTIPQIFISGQFVGGAIAVLEAFADGRLQKLLSDQGVPFDPEVRFDARALLPNWLVNPR